MEKDQETRKEAMYLEKGGFKGDGREDNKTKWKGKWKDTMGEAGLFFFLKENQ